MSTLINFAGDVNNNNLSAVTPAVSIIIPCYNSASFLPRAINSVLAQTWSNFELLIVDDGSIDNSAQVIEEFAARDARLHLLRHDINRGLPAARNTGIRQAHGSLVAFLDADDWWAPEKIATQIPYFDDPAIGACCVTSVLVYPGDQIIQRSPQAFLNTETLVITLLFRNAIPGSASSMVVRKQCFDNVGLFDENMVAAEDHDMWLRLAQKYTIQWIDSNLVYIDKSHPGAMTKALSRMEMGREQFLYNREHDVLPPYRKLLPDARRYMHIHTAIEYLRVDDFTRARLHSYRAITASGHINRELRRSFVLFLLTCIPLSLQHRFLRPLRKRILKIGESTSASTQ